MTKQKQMKLVNNMAEKLIKQVRSNLGIVALDKREKRDLMADFTLTIYDDLKTAGVFDEQKSK
jgi:hypothetical protein